LCAENSTLEQIVHKRRQFKASKVAAQTTTTQEKVQEKVQEKEKEVVPDV
jgi:hypothetical protein